jgi:hypothetical protein
VEAHPGGISGGSGETRAWNGLPGVKDRLVEHVSTAISRSHSTENSLQATPIFESLAHTLTEEDAL